MRCVEAGPRSRRHVEPLGEVHRPAELVDRQPRLEQRGVDRLGIIAAAALAGFEIEPLERAAEAQRMFRRHLPGEVGARGAKSVVDGVGEVADRRSSIVDQRSAISDQRSAISDQRSVGRVRDVEAGIEDRIVEDQMIGLAGRVDVGGADLRGVAADQLWIKGGLVGAGDEAA